MSRELSPESERWTLKTTSVFERNLQAYLEKRRIIVNQGGTSSSKTYSVIQMLVLVAMYATTRLLISITSESLPHLKRGCIRDFQSVLGPAFDSNRYNKTDHIYTFKNAQVEFFPSDDASKLRGGRRDILYINEANNISKNAFDELDVRTRKCTIVDYNPVEEFWAHTILQQHGIFDYSKDASFDDLSYIHSTFLDAKNVLPKETVQRIESRRTTDPNWWNVYGLGLVGNIEGLIHPQFTIIENMPDATIEFYGLDFGFSNDPTVLVHNKVVNDNLYSDQLIYETGLTNDQISNRMASLGVRKHYDEIYADCAEPKSIEEIRRRGFNIKPAPKGQDSVLAGIQKVNQYKQHWTKRSVDCIKEQRNWRYIQTADGKITNKPIDDFNHGMDARRYGVFGKLSKPTGPVVMVG